MLEASGETLDDQKYDQCDLDIGSEKRYPTCELLVRHFKDET